MGAVKQWQMEEYEREIAEQSCPDCDGTYGMDVDEGGCYCSWAADDNDVLDDDDVLDDGD